MAYDNNFTGLLFTNANKKAENHSDRNGFCTIDGRQYWISGWLKKDRNGDPFLSLSFKAKTEEQVAKANNASAKTGAKIERPFDDEIPF
jgi:hypothetical protein